ncbi:DUF493 family protein [Phaeocystidibacter luteus]|uniref:DUF493 domain-containing protein n=1 Tax=Phaeocystidibacter luteus TaxID=911197 RepID=A0A6N6RLD4_9FLAO|nr:DUF493 family protein [Phaeocystidibacter luteus]KAB2814381.1 DUF493 domain-containing protein [Phaeocystidibacter luteus]
MSADREAKYEKLRQQLSDLEKWPSVYMFKFIVPADNQKVAQVEALFNTKESQVSMRTSKNGNFVAITAKEMMMSPESVIERYRDAEGIEGLMSL